MTPSAACRALIQSFEQCRLTAYLPTPNDRPTIGWGATGEDIHLGMTWARSQCDARFAADLAAFARGVSATLIGETTQRQFDALVSLAYNIGLGAFKASALLRLHNTGDVDAAAAQFAAWTSQAGKTLPGLVRRRAAEAAMYRDG